MEKIFSVSQTAQKVGMTAETLRHYDRIGLVKPYKIDEWTGYRYYSLREIVKLNTVKALRIMDLTLDEIKNILQFDDFTEIIEVLKQAENKADNKIAELNYAKQKIENARKFYESKLDGGSEHVGEYIRTLPQRVILLSEDLHEPTMDNLWDYHRHFYAQLDPDIAADFAFEDLAGIYEENGQARLFTVCTRYTETDGLLTLPEGKYLCVDSTEDNRHIIADKLIYTAKKEYRKTPKFVIHLVVLTGILQWNYQTQVYND